MSTAAEPSAPSKNVQVDDWWRVSKQQMGQDGESVLRKRLETP